MKLFNLCAAALFTFLPAVHAAEQGSEATEHIHDTHAQTTSAMSEGEIRKIDRETGKVTIKHGPLENLGMPGMTMVFRLAEAGMMERIKEGDRIRFVAEKREGVYTVTRLEIF